MPFLVVLDHPSVMLCALLAWDGAAGVAWHCSHLSSVEVSLLIGLACGNAYLCAHVPVGPGPPAGGVSAVLSPVGQSWLLPSLKRRLGSDPQHS